MVQQAVQQRGDGGRVAEELAPVFHGAIRRDQRGRSLVAAHDDLEEVLGGRVGQPSHAEIVDEQERDGADLREVLLARAGELGVSELVEEPVGLSVEDTMALLDDGEADGLSQVAPAICRVQPGSVMAT